MMSITYGDSGLTTYHRTGLNLHDVVVDIMFENAYDSFKVVNNGSSINLQFLNDGFEMADILVDGKDLVSIDTFRKAVLAHEDILK